MSKQQPAMPAYANVPPGAIDYQQPAPGRFQFDGGAGSFFFVGLGVVLVYLITFGLALPWCVKTFARWQTRHTIIDGRRLRFTGSGLGLGLRWLWWWFLTIITLGIYNFWVIPRFVRWTVEHQTYE